MILGYPSLITFLRSLKLATVTFETCAAFVLLLNTATTIATSMIHSKLDYCNSLFLNLPKFELNRLQSILNSAARAITNTSKFSKITPVLKSLHWLKISERIHFKILSVTYFALQSNQPSYLRSLLSAQNKVNTRSSSAVSLIRPSNPSSLLITNRSFTFTAPFLWNQLPTEMRIPSTDNSSSLGYLFLPLSFTNASKLAFSTYPSRHRHLLPIWTAFTNF